MLQRLDALKEMVLAVTELQQSGYNRVRCCSASNADYVLRNSNFEEVLQFKNFLDERINSRVGSPIVVEIDGFGGDVYAAEQLVNIIADYNELVEYEGGFDPIRLKVGKNGIISAGHILWYDPRLSSLWVSQVAYVQLHQVSTLCKADLPFISENVRALCSHHTIENGGYDCVLSYRLNELDIVNKTLRPYNDMTDTAIRINCTLALAELADANRIPSPVDYVEMFEFVQNPNDHEFGVESDVVAIKQQTNLHGKVEEEMFEMYFENNGINAITERLDYINGLMLSWLTGHEGTVSYQHYVMAITAAKKIKEEVDSMVAAMGRDQNYQYVPLFKSLVDANKWLTKRYFRGAIEYWFTHQVKKGRVQAVTALTQFVEWLSVQPLKYKNYHRNFILS